MTRTEKLFDDGGAAEGADDVGPWVKDKHRALREFLTFHAHACARFSSRAYFDVFCSSGRARVRDTGEFVDGSPLVILVSGIGSVLGPLIGANLMADFESWRLRPGAARARPARLLERNHPGP